MSEGRGYYVASPNAGALDVFDNSGEFLRRLVPRTDSDQSIALRRIGRGWGDSILAYHDSRTAYILSTETGSARRIRLPIVAYDVFGAAGGRVLAVGRAFGVRRKFLPAHWITDRGDLATSFGLALPSEDSLCVRCYSKLVAFDKSSGNPILTQTTSGPPVIEMWTDSGTLIGKWKVADEVFGYAAAGNLLSNPRTGVFTGMFAANDGRVWVLGHRLSTNGSDEEATIALLDLRQHSLIVVQRFPGRRLHLVAPGIVASLGIAASGDSAILLWHVDIVDSTKGGVR